MIKLNISNFAEMVIFFFSFKNLEHLGTSGKPKQEMRVQEKMNMTTNIMITTRSMSYSVIFYFENYDWNSVFNSIPITEISQPESHPHRHQHGYEKVSVFHIFLRSFNSMIFVSFLFNMIEVICFLLFFFFCILVVLLFVMIFKSDGYFFVLVFFCHKSPTVLFYQKHGECLRTITFSEFFVTNCTQLAEQTFLSLVW